MAQTERAKALELIKERMATCRLDEIEDFLIEWVADWSTDEDARSLARQVNDRIENGE